MPNQAVNLRKPGVLPHWILVAVFSLSLVVGIVLGMLVMAVLGLPEGRSLRHVWARGWSPDQMAGSLSLSFARVAENVEPSVVHITTVDNPEGDLVGRGTGSGFIVDKDGHILTNYHVVRDATRINVKLFNGIESPARLIAVDEETDIAVVKISSRTPLQPVTFGDSDALKVGEWVVAIGSPFGLDQTVTAGIISAKERVTDKRRNLQQFIQTDAAINPGNSGGPLLNLDGEVIGINTQIATQDGRFNGISFAIPSVTVKDVYHQLVTTGQVVRGYLGVFLDQVSPQFAQVYSIPRGQGALVQYVEENGPAARSGLKSGDVIVSFDSHAVRDDRDLVRWVASTPVGNEVKIEFYRDGRSQTARLRVDERVMPSTKFPSVPPLLRRNYSRSIERPVPREFGLRVGTLTRLKVQQMGLAGILNESDPGVVVTDVEPSSVAADAKIRERDLIIAINRKPISTEQDFYETVKKLRPNDDVVVVVKRALPGERRAVVNFLSFTLP